MKKDIQVNCLERGMVTSIVNYHGVDNIGITTILYGAGRKDGTCSLWGLYPSGKIVHMAELGNMLNTGIHIKEMARVSGMEFVMINPETLPKLKSIFSTKKGGN